MSGITTHVLDMVRGRPASGVPFTLEARGDAGEWRTVGRGATDGDGRGKLLAPESLVPAGTYRVVFDTGAYFRAWNVEGFYPEVVIVFEVRQASQHHHVPLLLAPYGYSTYRGS
jgi:5-hydroxyisourate hydrolase